MARRATARAWIQPGQPSRPVLKTVTFREWSGGWNVLDSDLNLNPKFSKVQKNTYRGQDGAMAVRWGTRLFSDLINVGAADIVNMEYFNNFLIAVDKNGYLWSIDGTGVIRNIWSPLVAASLPGAPAGWGVTSFATFAASQGQLTVWNGSDKPLAINAVKLVTYLQDVATGSNVFVPRCK